MARNKPTTDAIPKYEVIEHNGQPARKYQDGSIRNDRGVYLQKPPYLPEITTDNARDMVRLREAKRIRLYNIGAARAVEDQRLLDEFGDDAHIVERARTMQQLSTTLDAGKAAVMAAAHLDKAQGLIIERGMDAPTQADAPITLVLVDLLSAITRRLEANAFDNSNYRHLDTVDADVADEEAEEGG